ncbi:MAG: tetratricopeptide repeat protein [Planctomycetota bacterium]|nr:tetratricopeptide repeat protein [Planctomycetota bacterium]
MPESLSTALQLFQQGQLGQAEALLHKLHANGEDHFELWHTLGLIAYRRGDLETAQSALRRAVERNPSDARLPNHLGLVLLDAGRVDEAIQSFRRAIAIHPRYAPPHFHLGLSFQTHGQLEEAVESYRAALRLNPDHVESWNNQGLMWHALRNLDAAAACFEQAIERRPDYVAAISNLGLLRHDQRRFEDAVRCFEHGRRIAPSDACLANNLGRSLFVLNRPREALLCFDYAIENQPDYADAWQNRGLVHESEGRIDEAESAFQQALDCDVGRADSVVSLGTLALQRGQFADAIERFLEAIQRDPCCTAAWYHLSEMRPGEFTDDDVRRLVEVAANPRLTESVRAATEFALGNVEQHRLNFDDAFAHFAAANAFRATSFDPSEHAAYVDRVIDVFSAELFDPLEEHRGRHPDVVFIVGMPRSGTTLVEQIVARHPRVHSGGELSLVSRLAQSLPESGLPDAAHHWPAQIAAMDRSRVEQLAAKFLEAFPSDVRTTHCLVDKTPGTFLYLGLIAVLFPRARIIHCRRHPLDTALSCYFRNFEHVPFSYDLQHIASYYQQYERLMEHWLRVLPLRITAIDYEQVVTKPEPTTRKILDAAGLDWEPSCLEFHNGTTPVQTASAWQVRQPVHVRSVNRWKNYRHHIESLIRELKIK